jgi:hypothetical protein
MRKLVWILALAVACFTLNGCASQDNGSREYKPGEGWVPA